MLTVAPYRFLARPREAPEAEHAAGVNCRSLIQDYFLHRHGMFVSRADIEQPGVWERTGTFLALAAGDDLTRLVALPDEAVLLAEPIRGRDGLPIDHSPGTCETVEDYRLHLHTALLLHDPQAGLVDGTIPRRGRAEDRPLILHATGIEGSTCLWDLDAFTTYYRLVAAKALLQT